MIGLKQPSNTLQLNYKTIILMLASILLSVLNSTMFYVALPELSGQFSLTPQTLNIMVSGYIVLYAVGTAAYGKLVDRIPLPSLIIVAFSLFFAGSLLCWFSASYGMLLSGRFIQACGASSTPVIFNYYVMKYIQEFRRGWIYGWLGMAVAIGVASGPLIGGFLEEDWRRMFAIPATIVVLMPLLWISLRNAANPIDSFSSLSSFHPPVQTLREQPRFHFWMSVSVIFLIAAVFEGFMFLFPLWLSGELGWSGHTIGRVMFPATAVSALVSLVGGKLADRTAPRNVSMGGMGLMVAGCLWFAMLKQGEYVAYLCGLLLLHAGYSIAVPAFNKLFIGSISGPRSGMSMGWYQFAFFAGGAFGVSAVSLLLPESENPGHSYRIVFGMLSCFTLLCFFGLRWMGGRATSQTRHHVEQTINKGGSS